MQFMPYADFRIHQEAFPIHLGEGDGFSVCQRMVLWKTEEEAFRATGMADDLRIIRLAVVLPVMAVSK